MGVRGRRRVILKIVIRGRTYTLDLSYLGENWGAPFIITFMIILMMCESLVPKEVKEEGVPFNFLKAKVL
jgi:hypothetical protein